MAAAEATGVTNFVAQSAAIFKGIREGPREVNGQPDAILRDRDGNVVSALTLDVLGRRIQTIRSVSNPDKLGHVGPVADAWAIAREAKQARRPND